MRIATAFFVPALLGSSTLRHDPPASPALTVHADAEVSAAPDRATVRLGSTVQAQVAATAQQQVGEVMQRTIDELLAAGVPEQDMQTVGISLDPVYSSPSPQPEGNADGAARIVAFRARNTLRVQVAPQQVGQVIDIGIAAGANELQGVGFEVADDSRLAADALCGAVKAARQKAEALAEAAGLRLLAIQRIETGGAVPLASARRFDTEALAAGTPVQPGRVRVRASVTMVYGIAPREGAAR